MLGHTNRKAGSSFTLAQQRDPHDSGEAVQGNIELFEMFHKCASLNSCRSGSVLLSAVSDRSDDEAGRFRPCVVRAFAASRRRAMTARDHSESTNATCGKQAFGFSAS